MGLLGPFEHSHAHDEQILEALVEVPLLPPRHTRVYYHGNHIVCRNVDDKMADND